LPEYRTFQFALAFSHRKQGVEIHDINLQWTDVPEGTGKMCQMLRDGETDIAGD
jgi:hypothetical protein